MKIFDLPRLYCPLSLRAWYVCKWNFPQIQCHRCPKAFARATHLRGHGKRIHPGGAKGHKVAFLKNPKFYGPISHSIQYRSALLRSLPQLGGFQGGIVCSQAPLSPIEGRTDGWTGWMNDSDRLGSQITRRPPPHNTYLDRSPPLPKGYPFFISFGHQFCRFYFGSLDKYFHKMSRSLQKCKKFIEFASKYLFHF